MVVVARIVVEEVAMAKLGLIVWLISVDLAELSVEVSAAAEAPVGTSSAAASVSSSSAVPSGSSRGSPRASGSC